MLQIPAHLSASCPQPFAHMAPSPRALLLRGCDSLSSVPHPHPGPAPGLAGPAQDASARRLFTTSALKVQKCLPSTLPLSAYHGGVYGLFGVLWRVQTLPGTYLLPSMTQRTCRPQPCPGPSHGPSASTQGGQASRKETQSIGREVGRKPDPAGPSLNGPWCCQPRLGTATSVAVLTHRRARVPTLTLPGPRPGSARWPPRGLS